MAAVNSTFHYDDCKQRNSLTPPVPSLLVLSITLPNGAYQNGDLMVPYFSARIHQLMQFVGTEMKELE